MAQRAGLPRDAAAEDRRDDVHAVLVPDGLQRLADVLLQRDPREKSSIGLAIRAPNA